MTPAWRAEQKEGGEREGEGRERESALGEKGVLGAAAALGFGREEGARA